jgi:hypothetical protein
LLAVFHGVFGKDVSFERDGIEDGGGEVNDFGAGGLDFGAEFFDALAVFGEPLFIEGEIDAAIHAVAGEDEIGFHEREDAVEALVQPGAWKFAVGVSVFAEATDGFAGEAAIDDVEMAIGELGEKEGLEEIGVLAGVGDAVTEEEDAFDAGKKVFGRGGEVGKDQAEEWENEALEKVHEGCVGDSVVRGQTFRGRDDDC